jgi:hypothetical protein
MKQVYCLVLSLVVLFSLGGCSRFVYKHADWWAGWYVGDYIDFNRQQKKVFKRLLSEQLDWHRSDELPRYRRFLLEQLSVLELNGVEGFSPGHIASTMERALAFWTGLVQQVLPSMQIVLHDLSDSQVDALMASLRKEQAELEAAAVEGDYQDTLAERRGDVARNLKPWLGKLTTQQSAVVDQWARQLDDVYAESLVYRKEWQDEFEQALHDRGQVALFQTRLQALFIKPQERLPARYRQRLERNSQASYKMMSDVFLLSTPKQQKHFQKALAAYVRDIDKLRPE